MSNIVTFTDVNKRENNEDACLGFKIGLGVGGMERKATILLLSDGMGGHEHGEVASHLVVDSMAQLLSKRLFNLSIIPTLGREAPKFEAVAFENIIYECMLQTNQKVLSLIKVNKWKKAGATIVAVVIVGNDYYWGSIGDSDLFQWKNNEKQLKKISYDHSMVGMLMEEGAITEKVASFHAEKHKIIYYMGIERLPSREKVKCTGSGKLAPNDLLCLCSDGISGKPKISDLESLFAKQMEGRTLLKSSKDGIRRDVIGDIIRDMVKFSNKLYETDNQTVTIYSHSAVVVDATDKEKEKILDELKQRDKGIVEIENEKKRIETELRIKSEALDKTEYEKNKINAELLEKYEQIRMRDEKRTRIQGEVAEKEKVIARAEAEVKRLELDLKESGESLKRTEKLKQRAINELSEAKKGTTESESEKKRLQKELYSKDKDVKDAKKKINEIEKHLSGKKIEVLEFKSKLEESQRELKIKINEVSGAEKEIGFLKEQLGKMSGDAESRESEIRKLNTQMMKKEFEKDREQKEKEQALEQIKTLKTETQSMEEMKDKAIRNLEEKNQKLTRNRMFYQVLSGVFLAAFLITLIMSSSMPARRNTGDKNSSTVSVNGKTPGGSGEGGSLPVDKTKTANLSGRPGSDKASKEAGKVPPTGEKKGGDGEAGNKDEDKITKNKATESTQPAGKDTNPGQKETTPPAEKNTIDKQGARTPSNASQNEDLKASNNKKDGKQEKSSNNKSKVDSGKSKPKTYKIKRGDTLDKIAKKYNVTVKALRKENGINGDSIIIAGKVLIIPPTKKTRQKKKNQ